METNQDLIDRISSFNSVTSILIEPWTLVRLGPAIASRENLEGPRQAPASDLGEIEAVHITGSCLATLNIT